MTIDEPAGADEAPGPMGAGPIAAGDAPSPKGAVGGDAPGPRGVSPSAVGGAAARGSPRGLLPMLDAASGRATVGGGPAAIDRRQDRLVMAAGIALAGGFLAAAVLAAVLPAEWRRGIWLPIHLGVAGAASVAIAAVMPFFAATLALARPVDPTIRAMGIVLPLLGIVGGAAGLTAGPLALAQAGGIVYLAGMGAVSIATFVPLAGSSAPRRGVMAAASGAALFDVTLGALLGTLYASNVPWVLERWALLRPAHAWINVLGFVGVIVTGTLVHLWPTVLGARIRTGPSVAFLGVGWVFGPPLVALGLAAGSDAAARAGAAVTILGAAGLAIFAVRQWTVRGRWTTDPAWHRAAIGHLGLGIAWGVAGTLVAAGLVLAHGAAPDAWSAAAVLPALGLGWIAQTIVGAGSHLVPTAGPGGPVRHLAQRQTLGRWSAGRLLALEAGVALLTVGLPLGLPVATVIGAIAAGGSVVASVGLLVTAVRRA